MSTIFFQTPPTGNIFVIVRVLRYGLIQQHRVQKCDIVPLRIGQEVVARSFSPPNNLWFWLLPLSSFRNQRCWLWLWTWQWWSLTKLMMSVMSSHSCVLLVVAAVESNSIFDTVVNSPASSWHSSPLRWLPSTFPHENALSSGFTPYYSSPCVSGTCSPWFNRKLETTTPNNSKQFPAVFHSPSLHSSQSQCPLQFWVMGRVLLCPLLLPTSKQKFTFFSPPLPTGHSSTYWQLRRRIESWGWQQ